MRTKILGAASFLVLAQGCSTSSPGYAADEVFERAATLQRQTRAATSTYGVEPAPRTGAEGEAEAPPTPARGGPNNEPTTFEDAALTGTPATATAGEPQPLSAFEANAGAPAAKAPVAKAPAAAQPAGAAPLGADAWTTDTAGPIRFTPDAGSHGFTSGGAGTQAAATETSGASVATEEDDGNLINVDWRDVWIYAGLLVGFLPWLESGDPAAAGDLLQITIPVTGLAATYLYDDNEGRVQGLKAFGTQWLTVFGLKELYGKVRPDNSSANSFPSAHTSSAFFGAEFINRRYGWKYGSVAYFGAVFTGMSRIEAQRHFADDVLVGASIGVMSNWLYVDPMPRTFALRPMVVDGGAGVTLDIYGPTGEPPRVDMPERERKWRYEFEMGTSWRKSNRIQAPEGTGTLIDLKQSDDATDPQVTGRGTFQWFLGDRKELALIFFPYEVRDLSTPTNPVSFNNTTFPAGTQTASTYVFFDIRARYKYNLLPAENPWEINVGAGLSLNMAEATLSNDAGTTTSQSLTELLPIIHLGTRYDFGKRWNVAAGIDGIAFDESSLFDVDGRLGYQIDSNWDVSLAYRYVSRELSDPSFDTDLELRMVMLGIGYTF